MVLQALQLQTPQTMAASTTALSANFNKDLFMVLLFFEPELGD